MNRLLSPLFAATMLIGVSAHAAPSDVSNQRFAQGAQDGRERGGEVRGEQGRDQRDSDRGRQDNNRGREEGGVRGVPPPAAQAAPNRGFQDNRRDETRTARGRDNGRREVEHGPSQFERRAFQRNFVAPRRFRAGAFRAPPGWRYRRWTFGESLPRAFWAQPLWITNFWLYDLDRPPFGTEWVRFGPDALLVDTSTGEILQADYNVFY